VTFSDLGKIRFLIKSGFFPLWKNCFCDEKEKNIKDTEEKKISFDFDRCDSGAEK
jgi:hypothetical protein